jgi:hypothetical protein
MSLKEHKIWVRWEDITTEEVIALHYVEYCKMCEVFHQGLFLRTVA